LALAARARPAASRRSAWDLCRAKGAAGCLEEAWFVLGVVGGPGRIRNRIRDDDATTDEDDTETPEDAAALFAAMRLYWALLDEDEDEDVKDDEAFKPTQTTTTTSSSSEREVWAWRRRLRGAVAFAPGALPRVWSLVRRELPTNRSLTDASEGMDTRGAWTAPTLARGAADVPERLVGVLGAFASAHAHLLAVVEDDEFFSRRAGGAVGGGGGGGVRAFTLGEHRAIAACVNTLVVRTHLTRDSGITARGGASSSSSSSSSSRCSSSESRRARRRLTRACAGLLRALRARDERRAFAPPGLWLAPASNAPLFSPAHAAAALAAHLADETRAGTGSGTGAVLSSGGEHASRSVDRAVDSDAALLVDCPHAIPFDHRVRVFRQLVRDDRARAGYAAQSGSVDADEDLGQRARPVAEIVARRGRVLEDAVAQILPLGSAARGRLAVRYVNAAGFEEAGIDAGGLFKELLADACGAGFDPARGVFAATADNLAFPAARAGDSAEGVAILELVGTLVGKGLYEGILQETRFAPHFAKYLLGAPRTLDDLASLDPELRRSLALILRHDGDVEDLCLDWTVREERFGAVETHELRPGGADRVVTNDDRLAYVHAVADFHLNRRRRAADAAFARGLARVVRPGWLRLFSAPELSQLMSGAEDADVDIQDLREHARYSGGYTETSRAVVAFWEVVKGFTPEERRALLKFVTSSSRPPVQGFRHLHPPFTVHKVRCEAPSVFSAFAGPDVDRLPSASTCFNVLKLPNYRRTSTMREKIRYAVQSGAGFELS
jgi:ubiquitin-protein ligase E3 B